MTAAAVPGQRSIGVIACTVLLLCGGLHPIAAQETALGTVRGRVVDAESRHPVAQAEILVDSGDIAPARTAADGAWRLQLAAARTWRLRVRHPGYEFAELTVDPRRDTGLIETALTPLAIPLDAIVVTAARRAQRLADAVVETELIGERELERSGSSNLAAVLTERSGMQLDGGVPAGSGVQLRGFDSRRVLVLLDGQPMVGRINGNFDLSRLPSSMVERIEIVKGPQSTLYGSDALGGVVNIITRRADVLGWEAGLGSTAGTQGRRELGANGSWRRGALGATLDGGLRYLDLAPGVPGDNGTFAHRWNVASSLRFQPDSSSRIDLTGLFIGEAQRYRTGQLFNFGDNTQWATRLAAEQPLPLGRLTATVHLTGFDHLSRASVLSQPVTDSGARDVQRLAQGDLLYNAIAGRVLVDAGVQVRHESIRADRLDTESPSVTSIEPFAQATVGVGALTVTPGARLSWSDRWGRFVAPRLAAMWRPRDALAVRASLGRGFRAPDFKELYLDFVNDAVGYAVRGNPALRPESSTSGSLGLEWTATRVWARVSAFRNDYHDFIETREPDASGTYTYDNIARGRTSGLELEGGLSAGSWSVDASYDYLRARDRGSHASLLGRPPHSARLAAGGPIALSARLTASLLFTGRTPIDRTPSGETVERAGWTRVDLRLSRPLPLGTEWSAGVTNLLDHRLGSAWPGFTGRQLFVALGWKGSGR